MNTELTKEIRTLVDDIFSLQWCRENFVIPLPQNRTNNDPKAIKIAIGNFSYLATIGEFIEKRTREKGYSFEVVLKKPEEIHALLDEAANLRVQTTSFNETKLFSEEALIDALQETSDEPLSALGIDFGEVDSENSEDQIKAIDLEMELMGDKVQKAVATLLIYAAENGISDIHIEPLRENYQIRMRKDGDVGGYGKIAKLNGAKMTAALKNMAQMDIAERRTSQDGKIKRTYNNQIIEFRCVTAPGKFGEMMVMRYLNSNSDDLNLNQLIVNDQLRDKFRSLASSANGIIIVSGPTGSGKSTTLASILREKDTGDNKIVTAEDPIEYDLGGNIQQFEVIKKKDLTFANLLRTFLRSDPDVILIGETRDPETAEASMDAAETGHLVFTTLHANSASSSLTRLLDMEVPAYKINSSLRGVLAQRLLKRVCQHCSIKQPITLEESVFSGIQTGTIIRKATIVKTEDRSKRRQEGTLCSVCNGSGYKGRIGTYELLEVSDEIARMVKQNKSMREINETAVREGMMTLKSYACELIKKELTTVAELKKICNDKD